MKYHIQKCFNFNSKVLKTKVLNLRTSNVIFDMFIRTCVQKCQHFPKHCTPLSPEKDTISGKINLIGYRPTAGPSNVPTL